MEYKQDNYLAINQWAEEDRPREKLLIKGRANLTDAELIGILLGSGTKTLSAVDLAKQILKSVSNDLHQLAKLSVNDLTKFKGIGEAKAITIVSALELGRRRKNSEPQRFPRVSCAEEAYELMRPDLTDLPHEEFWIILLRNNSTLIKKEQVSQGGISGTLADPRIIFKKAIDVQASSMILVHNHPSGKLKPSHADIQLTKKLMAGGQLLDIHVVDHLILADESYFSFAEEGYMGS